MKHMLILLLLIPCALFSQIEGLVVDEDNEPVIGALIVSSDGLKAKSDLDGKFILNPAEYPVTLIVSAQAMKTDTVLVEKSGELFIILSPPTQNMQTVVVSAGRHDQDLEDVSVSMDVLKPQLIDNKGCQDLESAVNQTPGVFAMDGQVSIRGGSGFAYGAGSRVLLLWNGMPILSGYAGDAQWNAIPLENASQIEVMKGASSVLYGSGALNGVISMQEREPSLDGEARIKIQSGVYMNPKRQTLKWWDKNPTLHQWDAYYGKMKKNWGFTFSTNGLVDQGYREGAFENRARLSGSFFYKPKTKERLKAGIGYNVQFQKTGNFIIWQSDSAAYTPSGGADTSLAESTLSINGGTRLVLDPYVKWYDDHKNLHNVKGRYYWVQNNTGEKAQSSQSGVAFADYQFQHKWGKSIVLTSGATAIYNNVSSQLFGDHNSLNAAIYAQYEHKFDKLDITGGLRFEYFEMDGDSGDSDFRFGKQSDTTAAAMPIFPIARIGAHYEITKATHLRASFGQGVRYPSVAERFTYTAVGALNVFPNPNLKRETGWAAEIGFKQVFKAGENWKGIFDVAGFVNQYNDMIEFTFGIFDPVTYQMYQYGTPEGDAAIFDLIINQGYDPGQILGFTALNAERARISGAEISFTSLGKIGEIEIISLIGYTYMNPISLNSDTLYLRTFSSYDDPDVEYKNILKYRFNHLFRGDVEMNWKKLSFGLSCRYNSVMYNIDAVFEKDIAGTTILEGLRDYRKKFDNGALVFDVRAGYNITDQYRVGFLANNIFNAEYVSRPGDVQPPLTLLLQVQMKF